MKILIAEDDRVTSTLVARVLTKAGHQVRTSADGQAALAAIAQETPDVLVTDWRMPGLDGMELVQRVRKGAQPAPAIVMITGNVSTETRSQAMLAGADEFLPKPARPEDIVAAVTRCIERARQSAPELMAPAETPPPPPRVHSRAHFPAVVVAASTGGPEALRTFLHGMPAAAGGAILIAQHGPAFIMDSLVASLQRVTDRPVHLGEPDMLIQEGHVYVAPGERHMLVLPRVFTLDINQDPAENFVRPAADPLLRSAAAAFGSQLCAVVLTGMGRDGAAGCSEVRATGGRVLVQDPTMAVAAAMPRTVVQAGLAHEVLPLDQLARATAIQLRLLRARAVVPT